MRKAWRFTFASWRRHPLFREPRSFYVSVMVTFVLRVTIHRCRGVQGKARMESTSNILVIKEVALASYFAAQKSEPHF
jgi:hypothetical protein